MRVKVGVGIHDEFFAKCKVVGQHHTGSRGIANGNVGKPVKPREVTRGRLTARGQNVKGLQEGMWVAIAGVDLLREGQKVTILESGKGS